jgi:hypothetical protein
MAAALSSRTLDWGSISLRIVAWSPVRALLVTPNRRRVLNSASVAQMKAAKRAML